MKKFFTRLCVILVVLTVFSSYFIYYAILNILGPSTEYYNPVTPTAKLDCDIKGCKNVVYLGDEFFAEYYIVRHKINGNCFLKIWRYAEDVDGPTPGKKHLLDYAELQFVGQNELRRPKWPSPPRKYFWGYEVNEEIKPQLDKPIMPEGVDELTLDIYVIGRYYCNALDYVFERYIQGGKPDETESVRITLKRNKP